MHRGHAVWGGIGAALLLLVASPALAARFEARAGVGPAEARALAHGLPFALELPLRGGAVPVRFEPASVRGRGYHAVVVDRRGRARGVPGPPTHHYRGVAGVDAAEGDFARLSFRPGRVRVSGLARVDGVLYDLEAEAGTPPGRLHVREITREELADILSGCALHTEPAVFQATASDADGSGDAATALAVSGALREIELGTEADAFFVAQSGGVDEAYAKMLSIVHAINGIYETDLGLTHRVTVQRAWEGSDPYTSSDSGTLLTEFRDLFWRDVAEVYDTAHLFSGRDFESNVVGRAYVASACGSYRYGVNQYYWQNDGYLGVILAHEEGHNLGALHTDSGIMAPSLDPSADFFNADSRTQVAGFLEGASCLDTVPAAGSPPVLDPVGPQAVAEGGTLALQLTATDPDGDPLTFGATPLPPGASITPDGLFELVPPYDQVGCGGSVDLDIELFVTDASGLRDAEWVTITVSDTPTGAAPVLADPGDARVAAGQSLAIQLQAADADGDALAFSVSPLPAGASLSGSGLFAWTPGVGDAGTHDLRFAATDCHGATATQDARIVVDAPSAPHLDALQPASGDHRTEVTVSGSGLAGAEVEVWFGPRTGRIVSAGDTALVVRPPKPPKGTADVDVRVVRDGQASDNRLPFRFVGGGEGGGGGKGGGQGKGRP